MTRRVRDAGEVFDREGNPDPLADETAQQQRARAGAAEAQARYTAIQKLVERVARLGAPPDYDGAPS